MTVRAWFRIAIAGGLCVAMMCSGCSLFKKGGKKGGGEELAPLPIEGEGGTIGSRGPAEFGEGTRITDPAAQIENVLFDYDSYQIKPGEMPKIDKAAEFLRGNAAVRLVAEGNCDERGSNEYNMSLGEHRADAVRAALIGKGIDGGRITTKSYGEEKPLDPGHTDAAWRVNRRAEFAFYR